MTDHTFSYHYAGQPPQCDSVLELAHDVWFDVKFTSAFDLEWLFVVKVRNEIFYDAFAKMTGCLDSGLIQ